MPLDCVLVINCGSSSLKFGLFGKSENNQLALLSEGLAESLDTDKAKFQINILEEIVSGAIPGANHLHALQTTIDQLNIRFDLNNRLAGIGHRVVHGGERFSSSVIISDDVINEIENCIPLAPLHNPANITGIQSTMACFPDTKQVAVFDTAFHQTMPEKAFVYGLPYRLYQESGVRRYGFHGTSHRYILKALSTLVDKPERELNLVTAHLGNGASVCAIKNGVSVDTSMGLTPLEGLIMGTRSGDLDPGIFDFLVAQGMTPKKISHMLNKQSGLLGISGKSNDMRTLQTLADKGNKQAQLAIDIFCYRLAKYIAGMQVALDDRPALVFTGGIGENSSKVRSQTIVHLSNLGYALDTANNDSHGQNSNHAIHRAESTPIFVIPTDEELMIAQDTFALI